MSNLVHSKITQLTQVQKEAISRFAKPAGPRATFIQPQPYSSGRTVDYYDDDDDEEEMPTW